MLAFSELSVQFLIDEHMENYKSIFMWMQALGFPESHDQYKNYMGEQENLYTELAKNYSDGSLTILDAKNTAVKSFYFYDLFPVALDSVPFEATAMDVNYLVGSVTFKYSYFKISWFL